MPLYRNRRPMRPAQPQNEEENDEDDDDNLSSSTKRARIEEPVVVEEDEQEEEVQHDGAEELREAQQQQEPIVTEEPAPVVVEEEPEDEAEDVSVSPDLFRDTMSRVGLQITSFYVDGSLFDDDLDHPTFTKKLSKLLKESSPKERNDFVQSFKNFTAETENLLCTLSYTISSVSGQQDSPVRALLSVPCIQTPVAVYVFNKMAEYSQMRPLIAQRDVPGKLLDQLRYLDFAEDSAKLSRTVFSVLDKLGPLKPDMIRCLPEILYDESVHSGAAEKLDTLIKRPDTDINLKMAIVECLSNLNSDATVAAKGTLVEMLKTASLQLVPAIFEFCLNHAQIDDKTENPFLELLQNLRDHLPLDDPNHFGNVGKDNHPIPFVFESLVMMCRFGENQFEKDLFRALEAIDDATVFDVFLLFALVRVQKKRACTEIRRLVKEGKLSDEVIEKTFSHKTAMQSYFKMVLSLAELFVRTGDSITKVFGAFLYKKLFINLDDERKQHVIVELVSHIGSDPEETGVGLQCLEDLVQDQLDAIQPFEVFIRNLLIVVNGLTFEQVRQLFDILSTLAQDSDDTALEDIKTTINKYIGRSSAREQMMGMIGSLMLVKGLMNMKRRTDEQEKEIAAIVQNVLEKNTSANDQCLALFYQQLAAIVSVTKDIQPLGWLHQQLNDSLEQYLVSVEESSSDHVFMHFDLESFVSSPQTAVNVKGAVDGTGGQSVLSLSPLLQLVATFAFKDKQTWQECRKWLVLPLLCLDEVQTMTALESEETAQQAALVLFHTANWFRQLLSTFCHDKSLNNLLVKRLRNLLTVEEQLLTCLKSVNTFNVPLVGVETQYVIRKQEPKVGKGRPKKNKQADPATEEPESADSPPPQEEQPEPPEEEDEDQPGPSKARPKPKKETGAKYFEPSKYGHFLTQFDTGAMEKLLALPVDLDENERDDEGLTPLTGREVSCLLKQLCNRLALTLPAKQNRFSVLHMHDDLSPPELLTSKELPVPTANQFLKMVPHLRKLIVHCREHFKLTIDANDGVVDALDMSSCRSKDMAECLSLCLTAFSSVFIWSELPRHPEIKNELYKALGATDGGLNVSIFTPVTEAVELFDSVVESVPDFKCAMTLLSIIKSIDSLDPSRELTEKCSEIAHKFLKRDWASTDSAESRSAVFRQRLKLLLDLYLAGSTGGCDVLNLLHPLVAIGFGDIEKSTENCQSETYKTMDRHTFPLFYRTIMSTLLRAARYIPKAAKCKQGSKEMRDQTQALWVKAVTLFNTSIQLMQAKQCRCPSTVSVGFRVTRSFISLLLDPNHAVSYMLEDKLSELGNDLMEVIRCLQRATRAIHRLSDFVITNKKYKQKALMRLIPEVRTIVERWTRKVHQELALTKASFQTVQIGGLRRKDLEGNRIPDAEEVEGDMSNDDDDALEGDNDDANSSGDEDEENEENVNDDGEGEGRRDSDESEDEEEEEENEMSAVV